MRDTHSIRWAIIALILGGIGTACTESSIISLLPDVGRHVGMTTESTPVSYTHLTLPTKA